MLNLQQEIVKDLRYSYKDRQTTVSFGDPSNTQDAYVLKEVSGREFFRYVYESAKYSFGHNKYIGLYDVISNKGILGYEAVHTTPYFDHYFRHLYNIIKFVDKFELGKDDFDFKYKYTSLVRAQLSRYELIFLFYNCLSVNGIEKFKPLLEKYSLLKNMRFELLANQTDKDLYEEKTKANYQEKEDADFNKEYRQSAFVPKERPTKKYKFVLPWVLDINLRYYRAQKEA